MRIQLNSFPCVSVPSVVKDLSMIRVNDGSILWRSHQARTSWTGSVPGSVSGTGRTPTM